MKKRRLFWRFAVPFFLITVLALFGFTWYSTGTMQTQYLDHVRADLLSRAHLVVVELQDLARNGRMDMVQDVCVRLGRISSTRITVIAADGSVVGDSMEDPLGMENHADRPEVRTALGGGDGNAIRYSRTVRTNTLYVAVPLRAEGIAPLVVRTALPLSAIEAAIGEIRTRIVIGGAVIVLLAGIGISLFARRLTRPVEQLRAGAEQFAAGNLSYRLPKDETAEFGGLADALGAMAGQLDERFRTILRQRTEQEAVLSSMIEGVIAVDREERVININAAAASLFGIAPGEVIGRHIQEAVRNTEIQRFIAATLQSAVPTEGMMVRREADDRHLQLHGTQLRDSAGAGIGAVVVLHDVTRLRRLESLRRDFVANVSHELKSPVTSIKGFVETLIDGAVDEADNRDRFLAIIAKEADRLHRIIEDLLMLSRIEQDEERGGVQFETGPLLPVLAAAVQACEGIARERGAEVAFKCDPALTARMSQQLLEEAVANLVENAVKYGGERPVVQLSAQHGAEGVVITVTDGGPGIAPEHLPRIFERFYRVDSSRERRSGSTGLGLAIVKHIIQAHGGTISVKSTVGQGTVFTVLLPAVE